jgi:glyoxylase-like metal-dependent hydrolase (beta-lactamase superfamily II)
VLVSGVQLFVDEGLGHSSYVVDLGDGTAAIVDPPRFPADHLRTVRARSLEPRWTFDTHSHADYVTGSPSLAADPDVTFVAPAASRLETPHLAVTDEQRISLAPA